MMVSPESFKKNNEEKTLKELINVKNSLLEEITAYETRKILVDNPIFTDDDMVKPSPQLRYRMNLDYLKEILELISEKEQNFEYGTMIFENNTFENNESNKLESGNDSSNNAKNLLKREKLIEIKKKFIEENNKSLNKSSEIYLKYLNNIEDMLKEYSYEIDDRFFSAYALPDKWLNFDDAINYLFDNISGNVIIKLSEVPLGKNVIEIQKKQDDYYNDGIICEYEKDLMLRLINEVKKYIISSNN